MEMRAGEAGNGVSAEWCFGERNRKLRTDDPV